MKTKSLIIGSVFTILLFVCVLVTPNAADAQVIMQDPGEGTECGAGETRNAVRYDDDTTKCEYHNNRCCCPDDF